MQYFSQINNKKNGKKLAKKKKILISFLIIFTSMEVVYPTTF